MLMVGHKGVEDALSAGLDRLDRWQLTGVVRSKEALQQALRTDTPDVLMVDAELEAGNGFSTTQWMTEDFPQVRVVALADSGDWIYIRKMLECGASGYVLKDSWSESLEYWVDEGMEDSENGIIFEYVPGKMRRKDKKSELDNREKQVLRMLVNQYSAVEISNELSIDRAELEATIRRLNQKTKAANPLDLKRYAIRHAIY